MALVSVKTGKISITREKDILKALTPQLRSAITRRQHKLIPVIKSQVSLEIRERLNRHPVIKSLKGDFNGDMSGKDLGAEFGLEPGVGAIVANQIVSFLSQGVKVTSEKADIETRAGLRFVVQWLSNNYKEKILNLVGGDNGPGHTPLPWVEMILDSPGPEDGIQDYGILFGLSPYARQRSRSGRALMLATKSPFLTSGRVPWNIPDIVVPFFGENFIEDSISTPDFKKMIKNLIVPTLKGLLQK